MLKGTTLGCIRQFSSTLAKPSHIGKAPIRLLPGVECSVERIPFEFTKSFTKKRHTFQLNKQLVVRGPMGTLKSVVPDFVDISVDNGAVHVSVEDPSNKYQRSSWGTSRAILHNNVIGTSEGHLAIVKLVGTGYRVTVEKEGETTFVHVKVGLPYIPKVKVPAGIEATSPNPSRLLLQGIDKQQVNLFAATIRKIKKPEPYKGKGIYVNGETIQLKQKRIK
ncbi:hypothetical protein PUMCH_001926 [Australozyma saopauloensis]|uniref:Large ribosomal subunit protein uL6 alpha-beta domain-containing protein n=1 Tax=Australozyma saopauloensis TaxID=291208 RepID=A0AAX4H8A1_9ASCO|nr:hypothetical protein PUMCH_001926 [[Candida] saopauloensis]